MPLFGPPQKDKYVYSDLSNKPGVFRLVKLLPPIRSLFGDTLRIEIIDVDAAASCSYNTLSYVWGPTDDEPDRRVIVECDGEQYQLFIHRACELALLQISTHLPLYVDQICINQKDKDERASQVVLMQDIYSNCETVLVWLGPASKLSDSYFDFAYKICAEGVLGRSIGPNHAIFPDVFKAFMDPSIEVTGAVREDRDEYWALFAKYDSFPIDGAIDVLGRSLFTRLWIIQELSLPPQVRFVCGTRSLCFDCFRCMILYYSVFNTYWVRNANHTVSSAEMLKRQEIFNLNQSMIRLHKERSSIHVRGERLSLYDLVLKYNVNDSRLKIQSSLMDDRIFAIMGLATPESRAGVNVRYDETASLFTELAATVAAESLDVLLFSQFPKTLPRAPSWVPDWSMDLKTPYSYLTLTQPVFNAGGAIQTPPTVNLGSGCLTAHGVLVDTIVEVGQETMVEDSDKSSPEQAEYRTAKRFGDEAANFLSRSRFPHDEMARVHLLDLGLTEKYLPEISRTRLHAIHEQSMKWGQRLINSDETIHSYHWTRIVGTLKELPWYWVPVNETAALRQWATKPLDSLWKWSKTLLMFATDVVGIMCASALVNGHYTYLQFRRRLRHRFVVMDDQDSNYEAKLRMGGLDPEITASQEWRTYSEYLFKNIGRRLYLTETGYVGTGPPDIEVGHAVAVLFGGTAPFILRNNALGEPGTWVYVGETHCEGIMNGEALGGEKTIFSIV